MGPTQPTTDPVLLFAERDRDLEAEMIRASNDILESGIHSTTGERTASDLARHLLERLGWRSGRTAGRDRR